MPEASRQSTFNIIHFLRTGLGSVSLKKRSKKVDLPARVGPTMNIVCPESDVEYSASRLEAIKAESSASTSLSAGTIFARMLAVIFSS
jgi:hypothetical protein